jgi:ABC-2 type transport system permease protein
MNGSSAWARIGAMSRKEFTQVRRDPVLSRLIVILPIVLLVMFGYALNGTVKRIGLAVFDASKDRVSQALVRAFEKDERFQAQVFNSSLAALESVRQGQNHAVLEIPLGAQLAARRAKAVPFSLLVDGSDPSLSSQIRAQASAAIQEVATQLIAGRALSTPGLTAPLSATFETLYNPDNRSAVYMVPGLIGLILTQITVLLTAIAIVREYEVGTMEALIATPIRPLEVVLGKIVPYLAFGLLDALIVLVMGVWIFGVPVRGNLGILALAMVLFVLGSLSVGIPLEGMIPFFNALSYLVPLRYFLRVSRGVMLRGAGLESLWLELFALVVFALVMLTLAATRFRKTL